MNKEEMRHGERKHERESGKSHNLITSLFCEIIALTVWKIA